MTVGEMITSCESPRVGALVGNRQSRQYVMSIFLRSLMPSLPSVQEAQNLPGERPKMRMQVIEGCVLDGIQMLAMAV